MNILLINHYAGSIQHGMEYRPYYLAREWFKLGHSVRIIAASESHLRQVKPSICGALTLECIDDIEYVWLKTSAYNGNGLGRVINMLTFLMRLFSESKQILKDFIPDIVIASSPHPFIFRGAKHIARKTDAKLVFEVRDLWPLSLVELLGMPAYHPLIVLMEHEERYAYNHSYRVASLLPMALDYMSSRGLKSDKFIYTPNGIAVDKWDDRVCLPDDHLRKIDHFKARFRFLVGYAGAHGTPNALSFLVSALAFISEPDIGIVLIGSGPEKENLIRQARDLGLQNLLFLDSVNKSMIPSFLSQMNALYIGWENQSLYRFGVSANKLFEYMMSGKPILHSVRAANDPVAESGCGLSCAPENTELIAENIVILSKLPQENLDILGAAGKEYVINHHDYAVLAKNYLDSL